MQDTPTTKKYDLVVYIGRFQILHLGHYQVMKQALQRTDNLLVLVGTHPEENTPCKPASPRSVWERVAKNPFTYPERFLMIWDVEARLREELGYEVSIHPNRLEDVPGDDAAWAKSVKDRIDAFFAGRRDLDPKKVALIGFKKDASSFYLDLFPELDFIEAEPYLLEGGGVLSSSDIRRTLFDSELHGLVDVAHLLPKTPESFQNSGLAAALSSQARSFPDYPFGSRFAEIRAVYSWIRRDDALKLLSTALTPLPASTETDSVEPPSNAGVPHDRVELMRNRLLRKVAKRDQRIAALTRENKALVTALGLVRQPPVVSAPRTKAPRTLILDDLKLAGGAGILLENPHHPSYFLVTSRRGAPNLIGIPGGKSEPGDLESWHTALREFSEEVLGKDLSTDLDLKLVCAMSPEREFVGIDRSGGSNFQFTAHLNPRGLLDYLIRYAESPVLPEGSDPSHNPNKFPPSVRTAGFSTKVNAEWIVEQGSDGKAVVVSWATYHELTREPSPGDFLRSSPFFEYNREMLEHYYK